MRRWHISNGVMGGLALAVIAMIWIIVVLLTAAGSTTAVLLVALLFLLPVLGIGALSGWLGESLFRTARRVIKSRL